MSRLLAKVSSSARSPSLLLRLRQKTLMPEISISSSSSRSQIPALGKRVSCISRLPVELSCLGSMMPLHSAIASARLTSILSAESQSWGLIPQGISMPL
ncbi:uncharacterized protein LOC143861818 [Tasmannia lanceolata]|uniref:uncharacterized protein LOC143861818 n=1 Tax=Tasmannia lanceolata TaxID=3420 RepID=UPI004063D8D9